MVFSPQCFLPDGSLSLVQMGRKIVLNGRELSVDQLVALAEDQYGEVTYYIILYLFLPLSLSPPLSLFLSITDQQIYTYILYLHYLLIRSKHKFIYFFQFQRLYLFKQLFSLQVFVFLDEEAVSRIREARIGLLDKISSGAQVDLLSFPLRRTNMVLVCKKNIFSMLFFLYLTTFLRTKCHYTREKALSNSKCAVLCNEMIQT